MAQGDIYCIIANLHKLPCKVTKKNTYMQYFYIFFIFLRPIFLSVFFILCLFCLYNEKKVVTLPRDLKF